MDDEHDSDSREQREMEDADTSYGQPFACPPLVSLRLCGLILYLFTIYTVSDSVHLPLYAFFSV